MVSQDHEIHSFDECVPEGSDYFQQTLCREHIEEEAPLIIREEKMGETEDLECRDHTVILYKGLSNQRTTCSGRRRSGECKRCDNYREWPP